MTLKSLLDREVELRDSKEELSEEKPDPLLVARRYKDEYISLICALFAYGNARQIVKFLNSLDFSLLDKSETIIGNKLSNSYYRFQKSEDIIAIFIALKRLKELETLENIFYKGYKRKKNLLEGLQNLIEEIKRIYPHNSRGYNFLVGKIPKNTFGQSPYKRYFMFLRWMVRKDNLDMGLWTKIDKKDLIIPLDTHTFNISRKLGLLDRKTYDLKSAILLTEKLKEFDKNDPVKYDFAIYRLGQEKRI